MQVSQAGKLGEKGDRYRRNRIGLTHWQERTRTSRRAPDAACDLSVRELSGFLPRLMPKLTAPVITIPRRVPIEVVDELITLRAAPREVA